ncbi:MAG: hypothetical protein MR299_03965 [Bacteroidales bacterium]|nr:hypothetical protein [Bacteroidales bacterium]
MKKKYQSPSLSVYSLHTEGLLAASPGVGTGEGDVNGSEGFTNKKQQTDMWGNDPNKGIWQ